MRRVRVFAAALALLFSQNIQAWFNGGHMTVAYIAYQNLTPGTRTRVDALLQLNPLYPAWTKGISKKQMGLVAFLRAATWPDCIKDKTCAPGYTSDGGDTPAGGPTDEQNIGYSDKLMHKYWHFVDVPFSAGSPGEPPKTPNAQTEIILLSNAIGTDESDDIKSYDVVWLEHLVGDVHQPLHATSRFTVNHPHGDAGGNFIAFCVKPCRDELHAYWDGLLGDTPTTAQVTKTGKKLLKGGKPAGADSVDPDAWVTESFGLAKTAVYVAPIIDDNNPSVTVSPRPDAAYDANAIKIANAQVTLAGYRLAALLNTKLK
ncbi:MAG: S1/P1 nuclease [Bryobacteraceae bacterium]